LNDHEQVIAAHDSEHGVPDSVHERDLLHDLCSDLTVDGRVELDRRDGQSVARLCS
jgi:hypothetical protein